eukprot:Nk52_evm11s249 gene=Nk52_evmTU11s249
MGDESKSPPLSDTEMSTSSEQNHAVPLEASAATAGTEARVSPGNETITSDRFSTSERKREVDGDSSSGVQDGGTKGDECIQRPSSNCEESRNANPTQSQQLGAPAMNFNRSEAMSGVEGKSPSAPSPAANKKKNSSAAPSTAGYVRSSRQSSVDQQGPSAHGGASVINAHGLKILMVSEVRGRLTWLNDLASRVGANVVIHTGNFGFFDEHSYEGLDVSQLKTKFIAHASENYLLMNYKQTGARSTATYLNMNDFKAKVMSWGEKQTREMVRKHLPFSELNEFLSGKKKFKVPVYTNFGHTEDIRVLEKFSNGSYKVKNLHLVDERNSFVIGNSNSMEGTRIRVYGIGGSVMYEKLFDNGDGLGMTAGENGKTWLTLLQIGQLLDTARTTYHSSEVRILMSHVSPGREALVGQLACLLKTDFVVSGNLHSRYGVMYNDWSAHAVENVEAYYSDCSKEIIGLWEQVKGQVKDCCTEEEDRLFKQALLITEVVPSERHEFRNTWYIGLPEFSNLHCLSSNSFARYDPQTPPSAASLGVGYGIMYDNYRTGKLSCELSSPGIDFGSRRKLNPTTGNTSGPQMHGFPVSTMNAEDNMDRKRSAGNSDGGQVDANGNVSSGRASSKHFQDEKKESNACKVIMKGLYQNSGSDTEKGEGLALNKEVEEMIKTFFQGCNVKQVMQTSVQASRGMMCVVFEDPISAKNAIQRSNCIMDGINKKVLVEQFRTPSSTGGSGPYHFSSKSKRYAGSGDKKHPVKR